MRTKFFKMKYLNLILVVSVVYLLSACGSGKVLTQKKTDAESHFQNNEYSNALAAYKEVINIYEVNNNSAECPVYTNAGISAYETGDYKLAISYLKNDEVSNFKREETFHYLAKSYKAIDNLSLELLALNDYIINYPQGKDIIDIKSRLFLIYVEVENYDPALELWPVVKETNPSDVSLLEAYLTINQGLDNIDTCKSVANELLNVNPENIPALEWLGKYYYRLAEDRYQKEMKAYDKKKTNKQYRILLKALDIVTVDFKKSLKYFKTLYDVQPNSEYANYLSHIYNRLSDKKKAQYYKKLSE